jgi:cysteine desulfurase
MGVSGVDMEVYLDHLASTPTDPLVLEAMLPWLSSGGAGNPHAAWHRAGWRAAEAVDRARTEIAALIGASPGEIIFTSGATEANNLALLGAVPAGWPLVASAIEHASVLACLPVLAGRGHRAALLPVDGSGCVDCNRLEELLSTGPAFVSIMSANNEIGTIQPLADIAMLCRRYGAILHVDAAQSLSTQEIDVGALGVDLLSLSGHKLYCPTGTGALFVRDGLALSPMMLGGGQQGGRRSGTVPVALSVGLGAASALALRRRNEDAARLTILRERLHAGLASSILGVRRNSPAEKGLPGCLHVSIAGIDAADLLLDLPDIALSTGSACAGQDGRSHVLAAIGLGDADAHASLRFGLGRSTTTAEIDFVIESLSAAVSAWRSAPSCAAKASHSVTA